jgi:hypothetical protein
MGPHSPEWASMMRGEDAVIELEASRIALMVRLA